MNTIDKLNAYNECLKIIIEQEKKIQEVGFDFKLQIENKESILV